MIARYYVLHQRLQDELGNVQTAATRAQTAYYMDNALNLDAAALNLHGFYNGVERLLLLIARQVDDMTPQGEAWHRELLTQMGMGILPLRPAVLQAETVRSLQEYLGFRHIVRNIYSWELMGHKVEELIEKLPETRRLLERDLLAFDQFLQTATHADEL